MMIIFAVSFVNEIDDVLVVEVVVQSLLAGFDELLIGFFVLRLSAVAPLGFAAHCEGSSVFQKVAEGVVVAELNDLGCLEEIIGVLFGLPVETL